MGENHEVGRFWNLSDPNKGVNFKGSQSVPSIKKGG